MLAESVGASPAQAALALKLAGIKTPDSSFADQVAGLGVSGDLLDEGLNDLTMLIDGANELIPGSLSADLSIARGLDYYTGSVYESTLVGHEDLGSICSGGRYDQLASSGKKLYPGVGLSIGVSRLLSRFIPSGALTASRKVAAAVYVAVNDESERMHAEKIAMRLRARGIAVEVSPNSVKFGKQIRNADRRGIPFVWFTTADGEHVRDIRSGEQTPADPENWAPPVEDAQVQILRSRESEIGTGGEQA